MQFTSPTLLLSLLLATFLTLSTACLTFDGTFDPRNNWISGRLIDNGVQRCTISRKMNGDSARLSCGSLIYATLHKNNWSMDYSRSGATFHFAINSQPLTAGVRLWARNYGC